MSRFARKQDANHGEIAEAYRAMGCSVLDLSSAAEVSEPGCPDLLVGLHKYSWLSETKTEVGKLNPAQKLFHELWKGEVVVVRTVDDVISIVAGIKKKVRQK